MPKYSIYYRVAVKLMFEDLDVPPAVIDDICEALQFTKWPSGDIDIDSAPIMADWLDEHGEHISARFLRTFSRELFKRRES